MSQQLSNEQLSQLAREFETPLYVYHTEKIKEQYEKLSTAFSGSNVVFFYACKALTNVSILKYVKSIGANIDCSSINGFIYFQRDWL
jgi:diaminopimelate decarboxylase